MLAPIEAPHTARSAPIRRTIVLALTCFVLLLALLLGGGTRQGFISDAVIQLVSLPLLALALLEIPPGTPQSPLILLFLVVLLPLLQLIPLPPAVWMKLPGREEFVQACSIAGILLPWAPISVNPATTWRSFLSLLPATAIFLGCLSLDSYMRRLLVTLILAIVFISAIFGLLQMVGGDASALRLYAITVPNRAVGFFANSNHYAASLYCAIPFAIVWAVSKDRSRRVVALGLCGILLVAIVIGLAISQSRAGLALGFVAGLISLVITYRVASVGTRPHILVIGMLGVFAALVIAFQFGFVGLSDRIENQGASDLRWALTSITWQAAQAYFPFGTGFGTFVPIFQKFEPLSVLQEKYVNRAHNDWLEIGLEGGLFSVGIAVLFIGWLTVAWVRAWRGESSASVSSERLLALAAGASIVLLGLHSTVDYPLRTTAMMVIFALSCAFLIPPKMPANPATDRNNSDDVHGSQRARKRLNKHRRR